MRVEEPLVLISCDERSAKRVSGCSVVPAETAAPAEVGYALSLGLCAVFFMSLGAGTKAATSGSDAKHSQT